MSRLFATCCGMLFLGYRLGYACFRLVCKGIGAIINYFSHLEIFSTIVWIVEGQLAELCDF